MKLWTRWQERVALAAGLYTALSTFWTPRGAKTTTTLVVLGVLIIIARLISLASPRLPAMEWMEAVLGALVFISPWVLRFTQIFGEAWTAWIAGGVTIIVSVWGASLMGVRTHQHPHRPVHA